MFFTLLYVCVRILVCYSVTYMYVGRSLWSWRPPTSPHDIELPNQLFQHNCIETLVNIIRMYFIKTVLKSELNPISFRGRVERLSCELEYNNPHPSLLFTCSIIFHSFLHFKTHLFIENNVVTNVSSSTCWTELDSSGGGRCVINS